MHYTRLGSMLHITSYLFTVVCHIRNPSPRVCDRSHSACLSYSSNSTLAAVSVVSSGDHNTVRKQTAENLLLLCGSCAQVFALSGPVTAPRRPLSAPGSQADRPRVIEQQDSVYRCYNIDDTAENFCYGCDVVQLDEN